MTDLFCQRPKKEAFKDWLLQELNHKRYVKTSEAIAWGSKNFYNRALRTAQELCVDGLFKRMPEDEKNFIFSGRISEDCWMADSREYDRDLENQKMMEIDNLGETP